MQSSGEMQADFHKEINKWNSEDRYLRIESDNSMSPVYLGLLLQL